MPAQDVGVCQLKNLGIEEIRRRSQFWMSHFKNLVLAEHTEGIGVHPSMPALKGSIRVGPVRKDSGARLA